MALLTPLSDAAASALLARDYGLGLVKLEPLSAGSVNSNFFLRVRGDDASEAEFFARIFEEQGERGAAFELRLNQALFRAGIPVARPIPLRDGSLWSTIEDKPFALYDRLTGDVICQKGVTPQIARSVGASLARVHRAHLGNLEVAPSRFGFEGIRERLLMVEQSGRLDLLPAVGRLKTLADRLEAERGASLPEGLIHGDLFRDNVLVREASVVGLLDFESASLGPYVYDLMVTILAWCFGDHLEADLTRAMVEGYQSVRRLTPEERGAMVLEGSIVCLRFATTRLTDFSLRTPEGQVPPRHFGRFFARLEALGSGALERALEGLS